MIWFTADPHIGHERILKLAGRRFEDIREHDDHMIEQTNRYVRRGDTLWVIGDVAWHSVERYRTRLVCRNVNLIWGNHDRENFGRWFQATMDTHMTAICGGKHSVWLSHYPHAYWPQSYRGSLHLYGHHHALRERTLDNCFPGRRSMDIGVDNVKRLYGEYRPLNEEEVAARLTLFSGHDTLQHYETEAERIYR